MNARSAELIWRDRIVEGQHFMIDVVMRSGRDCGTNHLDRQKCSWLKHAGKGLLIAQR